MIWRQSAVALLSSVVFLGAICPADAHSAQTACSEDVFSMMQVSTGLHQMHNTSVQAVVRKGNSNSSLRDLPTMRHDESTSTSSVPAEKIVKDILPFYAWFLSNKGTISIISLSLLALAIASAFCCGLWVFSENAPPLLSQTPYKIGTGSYDWKECLLAASFAFVGGWTDAICLLRYKAFATMMTGNFFMLGYTMIYPKGEADPAFYAVIIVAYFAGTFIFRLSQLHFGDRTATFFGPALAFGMIVFEIVDGLRKDPIFGYDQWVVPLLSPTFGVLNVVSAKGGLCLSTTFLSGHLQDLAYALVQRIYNGSIPSQKQSKLVVQIVITVSLVSGAVGAALIDRLVHDLNAETHLELSLVPVAPLLAFSFVMHDRMYYKSSDSEVIST